MSETKVTWQCPKGDSRTIRYSVTLDGVAQNLSGYDITLIAKSTLSGSTVYTQTWTGTGTANDLALDPTKTAITAGRYNATLTASKLANPGPWSQIGYLEILDHA